MSITIRGIRIESLNLGKTEGKQRLSGSYSLVSSDDKVLATQPFNQGYGGMEIAPSPATLIALDGLCKSFQNDVCAHIGVPITE